MRTTLDIETALYYLLIADNYSASAHAVPATLGATSPHIHVTRTGGSNTSVVIDVHQVDFDVYAKDQADAMTAALCAAGCGIWLEQISEQFVTVLKSRLYRMGIQTRDIPQ